MQGTVVVSGKRKAVQSMAAGVVSRILVSEGQAVHQGEPLFRLDRTQAQADVEALQAQYRMTRASLARWQSERDNLAQVRFPGELLEDTDARLALILEGQRQLFDSRRQAQAREQGALAASIDGSQAQLGGMRRARGDLQAQADSCASSSTACDRSPAMATSRATACSSTSASCLRCSVTWRRTPAKAHA